MFVDEALRRTLLEITLISRYKTALLHLPPLHARIAVEKLVQGPGVQIRGAMS
jgi:hypothetical protein